MVSKTAIFIQIQEIIIEQNIISFDFFIFKFYILAISKEKLDFFKLAVLVNS